VLFEAIIARIFGSPLPLHAEPRQNKAMKTIVTSNLRPLLRAFYPFLIAVAALCAMPRNARGQLYVSPEFHPPGFVSEYDTKTGAAINPNFITGLNVPSGLAVKGNTLFVADFGNGTVGEYDAKTGAAINANFITGLTGPSGLALKGNKLFVANIVVATIGTSTVGEYDAETGVAINASFITGLSNPQELVLLGNTLFVADSGGGAVGTYDATTGAAINANFITGLNFPFGIAVKSAK
jgi:hypothetical protein